MIYKRGKRLVKKSKDMIEGRRKELQNLGIYS